jgi:hypothetical protein
MRQGGDQGQKAEHAHFVSVQMCGGDLNARRESRLSRFKGQDGRGEWGGAVVEQYHRYHIV